MTTNKSAVAASEISTVECCMCGDYGFSYELFQCKLCHFRSQHRYCSNLYPKADSYRICNWCLTVKDESKEKSQNSSNSSSSNKAAAVDDYSSVKKSGDGDNHGRQPIKPIKKQRSLEGPPPPPPVVRRREENLRKTKSEEISHRIGIKRPVILRNKVRRYKLLEEVSS